MPRLNQQKLILSTSVVVYLAAITLAVSPFPGFDIYNEIKLFLLTCLTLPLMSLVIRNSLVKGFYAENRYVILLIFFLLVSLLIPIFFTSTPLSQQLWGILGRNNGYLTYFGLATLLLYFATLKDAKAPVTISKTLIIVSLIVQFIALLEIFGVDLNSEETTGVLGPLTTFGNPNFTSAFLGISTCVVFFKMLDNQAHTFYRIILSIMIIINVSIFFVSNSVQGLFCSCLGIIMTLSLKYQWSCSFFRKNFLNMSILITFLTVFFLVLSNRLFDFLRVDNSLLYRWDYWQAGLRMFYNAPLTGVGLNSYGDWYRENRSFAAATRGDINRISDSAHNTLIDLAANAGIFPLIITLLITALTLHRLISKLRNPNLSQRNIYFGISAAWIAWLVQNLISIEQIGIAIWGWALSGLLINPSLFKGKDKLSNDSISKQKSRNVRVPEIVLSIVLIFTGAFIGSMPLRADAKVFQAVSSNSPAAILASLDYAGVTAFHFRYSSIIASGRIQDETLVNVINDKHLSKFPRDFAGWFIRLYRNDLNESERINVKKILNQLDPFNSKFK